MAAVVPASQFGRDCGRVAVAEPAPQRRRLKLLGGSQDTTLGMPSNASPAPFGHDLRSCTPSATFPRAGSSVPPPEIAAVDISTPGDLRAGLINSSERESDDQSMPVGEDDRGGLSEVEGEEEEFVPERAPVDIDVRARAIAVGMASLDMVDMREVFRRRAVVMRTVPVFLRGAFKAASRSLWKKDFWEKQMVIQRAWKLFMLLPRMILFRPRRGGKVPRKELGERCQAFARGDWVHLVRQSMQAAEQGSANVCRRRRRQQ